jgi:nucleoside-diphosphate-sugar epimerase
MAGIGLILLTGATGFLGFRVLTTALKAGYNVRIAVRSFSKANEVIHSPPIKALKLSEESLSFIVVENMAVPGAFDDAVKGATYVIHCASPIPLLDREATTPDNFDDFFVQASRRTVIGLLESIQKAGTVRRVIITSSTDANTPDRYLKGQGDDKIFDSESRIPLEPGPYANQFEAYGASKTVALNESEAWITENKPSFDLISIIPGWIFGDDERAATVEYFESATSNAILMGFLRGKVSPFPINGNTVHVNDLAQLHVAGLDPKIPGNQAYIAASNGLDGTVYEDAIDIIKKHFPEDIAQGRLSTTGKLPTIAIRIDATKTEEAFGIKFTDFEGQVKSLVSQYLGTVKGENA